MDVVRLPKKYRDLCGVLTDGGEPDPKLFDAFREKFPHQAAAVEAELTLKERESKAGRQKLLNLCCLYGTAADALALYEELAGEGTVLTEMWHRYAIQRYLCLGDREGALRAAERWGASRLWAAASPTQVRPVCFFQHPMLHPFLTDPETIERLRGSGFSQNKGAVTS